MRSFPLPKVGLAKRAWSPSSSAHPLAIVLAVACCAAGCSRPKQAPPTLQRVFNAPEAEFLEVQGRGRWGRKLQPPFRLTQIVDVPALGRLVLPWTVSDAAAPELDRVHLSVEIGIAREHGFEALHSRSLRVKHAGSWVEEDVDLSSLGRGQTELEIRFGIVDNIEAQLEVVVSPALLWSEDESQAKLLPPDIVLIAIDTLRADHLSPYGSNRPTPTIEALARHGTLFEEAFSPAPWTLPSFSSVFTGRLPSMTGVLKDHAIPTELRTLGELFAEQGYRTLGSHGGGNVGPAFGYQRGFDEYQRGWDFANLEERTFPRIEAMGRPPLLLFLHTYDVHAPYVTVPEEYHSLYADADYKDVHGIRELPAFLLRRDPHILDVLGEKDLKQMRDLYDGEIRFVDDRLALVFEALDRARPDRERIVVVFSDHGEAFGDHSNLGHPSDPWVELTRVPLLISGPGVPPGRRVSEIVETLGLIPTLFDLAGLDATKLPEMAGRSFAHTLAPNPSPPDRRAVAMAQGGSQEGLFAVRTEEWTLLTRSQHRRLFDRRQDPAELIDVLEQHPEIADRLENLYRERLARFSTSEAPAADLDDEALNELRALGYIN